MKVILLVSVILIVLSFLGVVAVGLFSKTGRGVHAAMNLLQIVLIAIGAALIVYAISFKVNEAVTRKDAVFATATIIHYEDVVYDYNDERTTGTYYVYQYEVDGTVYRKTNGNEDVTDKSYGTTPSYYVRPRFRAEKIGQPVEIYYPPGRPQDALPVGTANTMLLVCLLVGGAMVFLTARPMWRRRHPEPAAEGKPKRKQRR